MAWAPVDVDQATDDRYYFADPAEVTDAFISLLELLRRPAWHRDAACRGQGTDLFFPSTGEPATAARSLCHTCPVQQDCLAAGMREQGVWGGTSRKERNALRRAA
ncbi:MAG: WhiB family transcriptional regulator [Acidimicrobiia bacterium]